ncbi:SDR family oxidoreductase [Roseibium sp.]|uniref:SDR family oxidoreductase n=1 Tax=Roseibium sp. TaxID=1936156 RepID=UPI003D15035A
MAALKAATEAETMKQAAVLGAYGFIGAACVRALREAGYRVTCIGRSLECGRKAFPDLDWVQRDFADTLAGDWKSLLGGMDVVVNASGALQDGARDNLAAIHETAVKRICEALEGTQVRFVQISAAGVSEDAPTNFFRTKARGDATIMASRTDWIILRPVLVLGADAYGGTALLRAGAAMPFAGLELFGNARIQTVHVDDVARAVVQAASGDLGTRFVADLTEDGSRSFSELVCRFRSWLGYPDWRARIAVPEFAISLLRKGADALGWLGWRSPLRTNALKSLDSGITGDPEGWRQRGGIPLKSLEQTLAVLPATAQERAFARLYLLLPLAIGCLSLFWTLSGLIGVFSYRDAMAVLTGSGVSQPMAAAAVFGGAVADLTLGIAVLFRRWCRRASIGMILVALAYLTGGTLLTPHLWADPLGPLVKVLPSLVLAALVVLVLEER